MTPESGQPDGASSPEQDSSEAEIPRRLSLGDPLDGRAAEDRPESWGERGESEPDRLARYREQTPPHHGG
ncbi:MAG TPA: hypothetical protein VES03_10460 [Motilibacterales bacterium]|nr:hypothetical protein [Motilibacterales bacterium]